MKSLLVILFSLFALKAHALEVEVISAQYRVENELQEKSLCLTVVRVPETGELLGIVEDLYDCFYARRAMNSPGTPLKLDLKFLHPLSEGTLLEHLQNSDTRPAFYFSEGE